MFKNENVSLNVFYIYYVSDFYAFVSRYFHFIDRIQSHSKNILFICRPYHCWCSATYLRTLLAAYSLSFGRNFYRAILVVTQDFSSSGLQTTQSPFSTANGYKEPIVNVTPNDSVQLFFQILQHVVIFPPQATCSPLNYTFLPEKLKELGYSTHAVGK